MENQKELMESRRDLLKELENKFKNEEKLSDEEYKAYFNKLAQSEKQMLDNKLEFNDSLSDILTSEQIAKLVVFEFTFMREIRNVMRKGRRQADYE